MAEKPDWSDGVRSPINTRAELKEYDPEAYDFFAKVYPSDLTLPAPWDEPAPDEYHGDYTEPPAQTPRETATDVAFGSDTFRIAAEGIGNDFQIDRFAGDAENPDRDVCIWFTWGDGVWTVDYENGLYTIAASDGSGVLSAISDSEVRYEGIAADDSDPAQKWEFVADAATEHTVYDGILVNASTGTALTIDGRFETGVSLTLAAPEEATSWMLEDTTRTAEQGTAAYVLPVQVTFSSEGQDPVTANVPQQAFTLPDVTDVAGADWSRDGYEFLGWSLAGGEPLDAEWTIPDGTTALALDATWDAAVPTDPEEPAPGDDTDAGASDGSGASSTTDNASADASGDLPRTGADAGGMLVAALIALTLGAAALIARRRIGARQR